MLTPFPFLDRADSHNPAKVKQSAAKKVIPIMENSATMSYPSALRCSGEHVLELHGCYRTEEFGRSHHHDISKSTTCHFGCYRVTNEGSCSAGL
jgi:hypothetical protein